LEIEETEGTIPLTNAPVVKEQQPQEQLVKENVNEMSPEQMSALETIKKEADSIKTTTRTTTLPEAVRKQLKVDHLPPDQAEQIMQLCDKYSNVWSRHSLDIGKISFLTHKIQLSAPLPKAEKQRTLPQKKAQAAAAAVDELIKYGIVEPSLSPYASNLHLVTKKDGRLRVTLDCRRLNGVTVPQKTSILPTEALLQDISEKAFQDVPRYHKRVFSRNVR
jgi:beta-galactosidase/beta-glucuronidase